MMNKTDLILCFALKREYLAIRVGVFRRTCYLDIELFSLREFFLVDCFGFKRKISEDL